MQDYTRLKVRGEAGDLAWLLVLDAMIFQTEAEVRWLDHCESRLAQARLAAVLAPPVPAAAHVKASS